MSTGQVSSHRTPPHGMAVAEAATEMVHLLSQQCELYGRLTALSDSQRSLITGNRAEQLLTVLAERQKLLDALQQLVERMRPYQERWPELRATMQADQVEQVDRLLEQVNQLLAGILEKDRADAQLLAARKQITGEAAAACKTGRKADAAYAAQAYQQQTRRDWTDS